MLFTKSEIFERCKVLHRSLQGISSMHYLSDSIQGDGHLYKIGFFAY